MYKIKINVLVVVNFGAYNRHQSNYHESDCFLRMLLRATRAAAITTTPASQLPPIIALHLYTPALRRTANTSHITRFYLYTEPDSQRGGGGK